jgi:3-hydroxyisobutyrate dehydrogenase-like beta-hydroxyacid dehydrogenase
MDIGFIGLGQMGSAIALNLVKAGHAVSVWNRSPDKTAPLVAAGAKMAATPAEASGGQVVFTMLSNDAAVEQVTFGAEGIMAAPGRAIHISMSTISLALAERLAAAHGEAYVSAPVFGRPAAAEAGKLFIVAAGPAMSLAVCSPLFEVIGQRSFVVGDAPKSANLIKLCGNYMIMAAIESLAEAMTLAAKNGVEKATLLDVLTNTLFSAPVYKTYGEILLKEQFEPAGFAAPLGLKDMNLVDAAALGAKASMPILAILRGNLLTAIARHGEGVDWSTIAKVVDENSGR